LIVASSPALYARGIAILADKDLRRVPEVFIGVFFVVHVMDESDDDPQFLVCAILPGE
jgi:hypothetical protein